MWHLRADCSGCTPHDMISALASAQERCLFIAGGFLVRLYGRKMMEQTVEANLIPVIVTWIAEHDSYATKTKLLKLLYLFDVEYYRQHQHTRFTGFGWKFFHLGPWAAEYDPMLSGLLAHGVLSEQRSNSWAPGVLQAGRARGDAPRVREREG